jgi:hypothetical protein
MHAWARWALVFVVCALSASVAIPARAWAPACTPAYLAGFDDRFATMRYDCVERFRAPVATRSGESVIRIIHDLNADWIADAGTMAEFERGVTSSIAAIGSLGGIDLENVTVLLADDLPPREGAEDEFSNIAAWTETTRGSECKITVYLLGPASRPEYAAWVTAHEIFHCVQTANLTEGQLASPAGLGVGGGGNWWFEGAASWFAALAVADIGNTDSEVDAFDSTSATTPLNHMAYEASLFFLWLGAEDSSAGVVRFMSAMAESSAESAQRAAMASALPQSRWLDFAEAYLDSEIRHPHGTHIGLSPQDGPVWTWSDTRTESLDLEPFVIARGTAGFDCGRWRTRVTPNEFYRARPEDGGDWSTLPTEINTTSGSGGAYRVAAINAGPARVRLVIAGTMEAGCGACMGSREIAACVIGTWQLTGGGPAEWMRAQRMPGNFSTSNQLVTYRRDGTFMTSAMQGTADVTIRDRTERGNMSAQAGGRWSTTPGNLNVCADMQAFSSSRGGGPSGPGNLQMSFTCSGGTLTTIQPMPRGAPPMTSTYSRVAE